jgi:DNA-binding XRE family transcriptional regulator
MQFHATTFATAGVTHLLRRPKRAAGHPDHLPGFGRGRLPGADITDDAPTFRGSGRPGVVVVTYARVQAGMTKTELAQACRVSLSLISEIESGTRNATPAMIIKLANALNCPRVVLERKRNHDPQRTDQP